MVLPTVVQDDNTYDKRRAIFAAKLKKELDGQALWASLDPMCTELKKAESMIKKIRFHECIRAGRQAWSWSFGGKIISRTNARQLCGNSTLRGAQRRGTTVTEEDQTLETKESKCPSRSPAADREQRNCRRLATFTTSSFDSKHLKLVPCVKIKMLNDVTGRFEQWSWAPWVRRQDFAASERDMLEGRELSDQDSRALLSIYVCFPGTTSLILHCSASPSRIESLKTKRILLDHLLVLASDCWIDQHVGSPQ